MPTVVVPFRADGKTRLPQALRLDLAQAMLADVIEAALGVGRVIVVGDAPTAVPDGDVEVLADPGGGLGAAVAAALARGGGTALVVNADVPCVTPEALGRLAAAGAAFVRAADGTTNALSLPDPSTFRPVYGAGSAQRFAALGLVPVSIPALEHDVDTLADLALVESLMLPLGCRTILVTDRYKAVVGRAR